MKFKCPNCSQNLSAGPKLSGRVISCPTCDKRIRVPEISEESELRPVEDSETRSPSTPSTPAKAAPAPRVVERKAWRETDPTNPPILHSVGLGVAALFVWYLLLLPFRPAHGAVSGSFSFMEFLASLFYRHLLVSVLNTFFFSWGMAIIALKYRKILHQKAALLLDVLPAHLGRTIEPQNVGLFIDHVYQLPNRLRDSLMVNRIRKGLELYEVRHDASEVREMMSMQSEIDSARIGTSYTLIKAFLWAIPLMGFIGTVVGLSQAIGGMNFSNVEDISKIVGSINNVTSGLGTAFDATLLGLVLALMLNFPLNSLAKQEDDTLTSIDAFCNEVLLPRLQEKSAPSAATQTLARVGGHPAPDATMLTAFVEQLVSSLAGHQQKHIQELAAVHERIVDRLAGHEQKIVGELETLTARMTGQAAELNERIKALQQSVSSEWAENTQALRTEMTGTLQASMEQIVKFQQTLGATVSAKHEELRSAAQESVEKSTQTASLHLEGLEAGIKSLNKVLEELGSKQITVVAPARRRWFGW